MIPLEAALAALRAPAFVVGGAAVSWSELVGDVSGVACVWLLARGSLWNWPIGLVNNVMWATLFFDSRLYGDATLQGVFFTLGVYGWWSWTGGTRAEPLPVRRIDRRTGWAMAVATAAATGVVGLYLAHATDSPVPLPDASILTLSLAATYAQARKLVESWWIWIGVDVISVPLYVNRGLFLTAAVYALFGALCVAGLRAWNAELERGRASAPAVAET